MRKLLIILLLALACSQTAFAQRKQTSGNMVDTLTSGSDNGEVAAPQVESDVDTMFSLGDSAAVDVEEDEDGVLAKSDSNKHEFVRHYLDENKLALLRRDKDFQYKDMDSANAARVKPKKLSGDGFAGFDSSILLWLLLAVAVVIVVLQLTSFNMRQIFSSRKIRDDNETPHETDNIHQINFEEAIGQATAAGDYSGAAKLMYLKSLKRLSDRELISLHIHKTNWHYVYELKDRQLQSAFKKITTIFEYIRYGNMNVSKEKFAIIQQAFTDFHNRL